MSIDSDYIKDGFKVFRSILDPWKLSDLKNDITYTFNKQIKRLSIVEDNFESNLIKFFQTDLESFKSTGKIVQNLPGIFELMVSPTIFSVLEHRMGISSPVITTKPVVFFHNKNLATEEIYYKTPPHQDYHSIRSSLDGVVVWFSLCDVDEKLGALKVLPGSHLRGSQWTEEDHSFGVCKNINEKDLISIPVKCGDMIVFNQMLIHASGDNQYEDRIRWSVNLRYGNLENKHWQDRGYESPYEYKSKPKLFKGPSEQDMRNFFNA